MKAILKTIFYTVLTMPFVSWADIATPPRYIVGEYEALKARIWAMPVLSVLSEILLLFLLVVVYSNVKNKLSADTSCAEKTENLENDKNIFIQKCYKNRKILLVAVKAAAIIIFVIATVVNIYYVWSMNRRYDFNTIYNDPGEHYPCLTGRHKFQNVPNKAYQKCEKCKLRYIPGSRPNIYRRPEHEDMERMERKNGNRWGWGNTE